MYVRILLLLTAVAACCASPTRLEYDASAPPPASIAISSAVESLTVNAVNGPSLNLPSLAVDISNIWYDTAAGEQPSLATLAITLTDVRIAAITVTSAAYAVSHDADACEQLLARRPGPSHRLRRVVLSVRHTAGSSVAVMHSLSALLLCNATVRFVSLQNSDVVVVGSALSNTSVRAEADAGVGTQLLRVDLRTPLSLRRRSSVVVDGIVNAMWRLTAVQAGGLLLLHNASTVVLRGCSLASDVTGGYTGASTSGTPSLELDEASELRVVGNECGLGLLCGVRLTFGAVRLRRASVVSVSANSVDVVTMAQSSAQFAFYVAGVAVSWASLVVSGSAAFAVDGNAVATDSRGVSVVGGLSSSGTTAADVRDGGTLTVRGNSVVIDRVSTFSVLEASSGLVVVDMSLASSIGTGTALAVSGMRSCVNVSHNAVRMNRIGENVSVAFANLQRVALSGASALVCADGAAAVLGGNASLHMATSDRGVVMTLDTFTAHALTGAVTVATRGVVVLGGATSAMSSLVASSVVTVGSAGACGSVVISGAVSVSSDGALSVAGHRCVAGVLAAAATVARLLRVAFGGSVTVAGGGVLSVDSNRVSLSTICAASSACYGIAVELPNSAAVAVTDSGVVAVSSNEVPSLVSSSADTAAVAVVVGASSALTLASGGALVVRRNTVGGLRCQVAVASVRCAGVLLQLSPSEVSSVSSGGAVQLAENAATVTAVVSDGAPPWMISGSGWCAAGVAVAGPRSSTSARLDVVGSGAVSVSSNTVTVDATNAHAYGVLVCLGVALSLRHGGSLVLQVNIVVASGRVTSSGITGQVVAGICSPNDGLLQSVINGSTVRVLVNTVTVTAGSALSGGVCWLPPLSVAQSSRVSVVANTISASGATPRGVYVTTGGVALALTDAARLEIEENTIIVSVGSGAGVQLLVTCSQSSTSTPGALSLMRSSSVSVSMNDIRTTSRLWYGIYVAATNSEGPALIVTGASVLALDDNTIVSSSGDGGIVLVLHAAFTAPLSSAVKNVVGVSDSLLVDACSCVIASTSSISFSTNAITTPGNALYAVFHVDYALTALSGGQTVPKGFLLARGNLFFRRNRVQGASHGIVLVTDLKPTGPYVTNPVASAYVLQQSIIAVTECDIRAGVPIRWLTSVAGTSYNYNYDCSYEDCSGTGSARTCTTVHQTCTATHTHYMDTSTLFDSSALQVSKNILAATSQTPAVLIDRSTGRLHSAVFTNGATMLFAENVMASVGGYESIVDLFRCIPSVSGECLQDRDRGGPNANNDPPDLIFYSQSALLISSNGISGAARGFAVQVRGLRLGGGAKVLVQRNVISATTSCVAVVGTLVLPPGGENSNLRFWQNKCNRANVLLEVTTVIGSGGAPCSRCLMFHCNALRGRLVLNPSLYYMQSIVLSVGFQSPLNAADTMSVSLCVTLSFSRTRTPTKPKQTITALLPETSTVTKQVRTRTNTSTLTRRWRAPSKPISVSCTQNSSLSGSQSVAQHTHTLLMTNSDEHITSSHTVRYVSRSPTLPLSPTVSDTKSLTINRATLSLSNPHTGSVSASLTSDVTHSASCFVVDGIIAAAPLFEDIVLENHDLFTGREDTPVEAITATRLQHLAFATSPLLPLGNAQQIFESLSSGEFYHMDRAIAVTLVSGGTVGVSVASGLLLVSRNTSLFNVALQETNETAAIPFVLGDRFVVRVALRDLPLHNPACGGDSFVALTHVQIGHGLSAAQLALRTSLSAATVGVFALNLFSGEAGGDLSALALTGLMACASRGSAMSNGFGALNILAPMLMQNTFTSVIYSNVALVLVVVCLQVVGVACVYLALRYAPGASPVRLVLRKVQFLNDRRRTGNYSLKPPASKPNDRSLTVSATPRNFLCMSVESTDYNFLSKWLAKAKHAVQFCLYSGLEVTEILDTCDITGEDAAVDASPVVTQITVADLCTLLVFPGVSVTAALSVYPGTLFAAIRLMQLYGAQPPRSGTPDAFDVSAGGLAVGVVFTVLLLPLPGVLYWLAMRRIARSYHTFTVPLGESKRAYTAKYRLFTVLHWLEPRGRLFPSDASKTWGPLVSSARVHGLWTVLSVFGGWVMCVACLLQFHRERLYCTIIFGLLAAANAALGVAVIALQPRRSPAVSVLAALMLLITGVVLAASAATALDPSTDINDTLLLCLGVTQMILAFLLTVSNYAAMFGSTLQNDRGSLLQRRWQVGPLCSEAKVADDLFSIASTRKCLRQQLLYHDAAALTRAAAESRGEINFSSARLEYERQLRQKLKEEGLWLSESDIELQMQQRCQGETQRANAVTRAAAWEHGVPLSDDVGYSIADCSAFVVPSTRGLTIDEALARFDDLQHDDHKYTMNQESALPLCASAQSQDHREFFTLLDVYADNPETTAVQEEERDQQTTALHSIQTRAHWAASVVKENAANIKSIVDDAFLRLSERAKSLLFINRAAASAGEEEGERPHLHDFVGDTFDTAQVADDLVAAYSTVPVDEDVVVDDRRLHDTTTASSTRKPEARKRQKSRQK